MTDILRRKRAQGRWGAAVALVIMFAAFAFRDLGQDDLAGLAAIQRYDTVWKWSRLIFWAGTLVAVVCAVWAVTWELYIRAKVNAAGGTLCPRCLYDLRGSTTACPECGREFGGLDDVRDSWRNCQPLLTLRKRNW